MISEDTFQSEHHQLSCSQQFPYLNRHFSLKEDIRANYLKLAQILGRKSFQMNYGSLYLDETQITSQGVNTIFTKLVKQSYLSILVCNKLSHSKILSQINRIAWKNLHTLSLDQNDIQNIQDLVYIENLESLKILSLACNRITKIRPLVKLSCPNLQELDLVGNKIAQMDYELYDLKKLRIIGLNFNNISLAAKDYFKFKAGPHCTHIQLGGNSNIITPFFVSKAKFLKDIIYFFPNKSIMFNKDLYNQDINQNHQQYDHYVI